MNALHGKIVTPDMMRRMDQTLMHRKNIEASTLTEEVGRRLADAVLDDYAENVHACVCFAGPGNNGADALHLTRFLHERGWETVIYVLKRAQDEVLTACIDDDITVHVLDEDHTTCEIGADALIIDGIFGSGLDRPLSPFFRTIIETINQTVTQVVAIDIPSGIHGETGMKMPVAVRADTTYVIGLLKSGNLLSDAPDHQKERTIIDIGFDERDLVKDAWDLVDESPNVEKRKYNTHKYDYGLAVFVGGEKHMPGAITMAALAAMRSGLGLAKILFREEDFRHYRPWVPEIVLSSFRKKEFSGHFNKADAVCFGPGMAVDDQVYADMLKFLLKENMPLVVDAGGFTHIADMLEDIHDKPLVLTPHHGEFKRLMKAVGLSSESLVDALRFFQERGITLVLKGNVTVIASSEGITVIEGNNPGLATAGSGDVLAGMVTAYLARGCSPRESAVNGVLLHKETAALVRDIYGETSMMATDLLDHIHHVMKGKEDDSR